MSRFGLRKRVITAFGLLALVLSLILSITTYLFARNSLLSRVEATSVDRAVENAAEIAVLGDQLATIREEGARQLVEETIFTPEGTASLLQIRDAFFSSNAIGFGEADLDESLKLAVDQGSPVKMVYDLRDEPSLVIGLPLPRAGAPAAYFEETSIVDVEDTINRIAIALLGASALTTLAGVALGFYAGRTVLSPLRDISSAAAQIAEGDLSTRLGADPDPDLQKLSGSFNNMATALQERIERDARFASDVSHELRSPLMTLTASSAVLQRRREELPERAQVAVDLMTADVARFTQLVEDLLEISRFDVGAAALEREPLGVEQFVTAVLKQAGHPEVPIITAYGASDIVMYADKRRMGQVMRNLIDNADYYGGGATAIRIREVDDEIEIVVEDDGEGVPKDERSVIFDRFARGREGGRRGSGTGAGLGLALVTEHVALHGGRVAVEDRKDGKSGARFVVRIPRGEASE